MKEAPAQLSDVELVSRFRDLLITERETLVSQLEHLAELDRRQLFFAYPSLWAYLVQECGMEEWEAERKIRAARLMRRFPEIKAKLESGKLNLSLLELASRAGSKEKLTDPELMEILESLSGPSCRKARREIAARFPESAESYPDRVRPISAELSEVRFVAPQELLEKLDELKALLAHSHPGISYAQLIDLLATEYRKRRHTEAKAERAEKSSEAIRSPRTEQVESESSVHAEKGVPTQAMLHEIIRRDGYGCSYQDADTGQRCHSTFALEVDHIHAWSGGGATEANNLRLLCRNHHRRMSFLQFGDRTQFRRRKEGAPLANE